MSFELYLYPLEGLAALREQRVCCSTRLHLDQDYKIFGQLMKLDDGLPVVTPQPLPEGMKVDFCWDINATGEKRWKRKNPYGDELVFLYAKDFRKVRWPRNASPKNKTIRAFLKALPADTPVILEWR